MSERLTTWYLPAAEHSTWQRAKTLLIIYWPSPLKLQAIYCLANSSPDNQPPGKWMMCILFSKVIILSALCFSSFWILALFVPCYLYFFPYKWTKGENKFCLIFFRKKFIRQFTALTIDRYRHTHMLVHTHAHTHSWKNWMSVCISCLSFFIRANFKKYSFRLVNCVKNDPYMYPSNPSLTVLLFWVYLYSSIAIYVSYSGAKIVLSWNFWYIKHCYLPNNKLVHITSLGS